jgi:hypothetical protein
VSQERSRLQPEAAVPRQLLVEVARVFPCFVLPLIPKLIIGGDRTMDLAFAASSDGVVGHQLGNEDFFSGAGELNSTADTVSQRNQVF